MGLTAKDSGGNFVPPPSGTHPGVCCAIIDLGTQYSEQWNKHQHKVSIGWELECEPMRDDGSPHTVWKRFTVSLHKKSDLRHVLEAWRGRSFTTEELEGFNLKNVLGKGCMITLTHQEKDGNTYANIASVSALPKKMPSPTVSKAPIMFDLDEPDMALFATFSTKLQDLIKASAEWKERTGEAAGAADEQPPPHDDDSIPF